MIDLNKIKLYSQSWYSTSEYDLLIENELIPKAKSFINELISWKYVPEITNFKQLVKLENNGKIYLDKKPVSQVNSIFDEDVEIKDFCLDKYRGIIKLNCYSSCCSNLQVDYNVGGITLDYPIAIENIIIELVLKRLNFTINNSNGFKDFKVGSDIALNFMFELTEEQKLIISKYNDLN